MTMTPTEAVIGRYVAVCDQCGATHPATFSHPARYGSGPIFAVVCPVDQLTDYYNEHGVMPAPADTSPALDLPRPEGITRTLDTGPEPVGNPATTNTPRGRQ